MSGSSLLSEDSLPAIATINAEEEAAYFEWQNGERSRLQKFVKFFKKTDQLESNIYDLVSSILYSEPVQGANPFEMDDITEIIDSFP